MVLKNRSDVYNIYNALGQALTLVECCNIFKSYNKDYLHSLFAPEQLFICFYKYVKTSADARMIAEVYMESFGSDIIISREASYSNKKLLTIMDILDDSRYCSCDVEKFLSEYVLVKIAFNKQQFKRAKDCKWDVLYRMYCSDSEYVKCVSRVLMSFIDNYKENIINDFSKLNLDNNEFRKRRLSDAYDEEVIRLTKHKSMQ